MKKIIILLFAMLFVSQTKAQTVPQAIAYQAVARDANNILFANAKLDVRIGILSGSITGTLEWQETHSVTTNNYGLFTLSIGQGISTSIGAKNNFSDLNWGAAGHYLKIEINDGNGFVDLGTNELLSVPYAFVSGTTLDGITGPTGPNGLKGDTGIEGATGVTGATGMQGIAGSQGATGATGSIGPKGDIGTTGIQGATGATGADGSKNAWGLTGNAGTAAGTNFIGTIDSKDVVLKTDNMERLRISSGGNIGIGTTNPGSKLHIKDGAILFQGTTSSGVLTGQPTKLTYISEKGALRLGIDQSSYWANDSIGNYSIATGRNTVASNNYAIAMGSACRAIGEGSVAMGVETQALSNFAVAMGVNALAQNDAAFALGYNVSAKHYHTFAIGYYAETNAQKAYAIGTYVRSNGDYAFAIGKGYDDSKRLTNTINNSLIIGFDSVPTFFVDKNNVGIGTTSPTAKLQVNGNICYSGSISACSDSRYKKNIGPISNALAKVLQINGVYYDWKKEMFEERGFEDKHQVGFIAQDLEKIFPEVVFTANNGYKSVDYSKLTPLLIQAIKEQQEIIEKQSAEIEGLKSLRNDISDIKAEFIKLRGNIHVEANSQQHK